MSRFVARIGFTVIASAGGWWLAAAPVAAQSFTAQTINSQSNLFGAGRSGAAPDPGGNGGGILPPVFSLTPGSGRVLTFTSVTGSVSYNNDVGDPNRGQFNGPDGGFVNYPPANTDGFNTNINSYDGISGLQLIETVSANRRVMFLAGVFLNDSVPAGTAPARLDFSSTALGTGFSSLSPLLNQTFFIGDGLTATGSGLQQQLSVQSFASFQPSTNGSQQSSAGVENIKEETLILSVPNNITREEIIYLLKKNTTSNGKHYKIISILKYNITLNPDQVTKYVNTPMHETETYLEEIKHIDSISFDKSICVFQDLTDICFIFYEKLDKNKNNVTKRIVLNNKKKKGTRKDY